MRIKAQDGRSIGNYEKCEINVNEEGYRILGGSVACDFGISLGFYSDSEQAESIINILSNCDENETFEMPQDKQTINIEKENIVRLCNKLRKKYGWNRHKNNMTVCLEKVVKDTYEGRKRGENSREITVYGGEGVRWSNDYEMISLLTIVEIDFSSYEKVGEVRIRQMDCYESEKRWVASKLPINISTEELDIISKINSLLALINKQKEIV